MKTCYLHTMAACHSLSLHCSPSCGLLSANYSNNYSNSFLPWQINIFNCYLYSLSWTQTVFWVTQFSFYRLGIWFNQAYFMTSWVSSDYPLASPWFAKFRKFLNLEKVMVYFSDRLICISPFSERLHVWTHCHNNHMA